MSYLYIVIVHMHILKYLFLSMHTWEFHVITVTYIEINMDVCTHTIS